MPKLKKGKAYVPSSDEIKRLLKIISTTSFAKRDRLLILMSYGLGLRVMELAMLKIYHVINEDGTINECISLVKTKGNKPRMVYMPKDEKLYQAVRDYINERKSFAEKKNRTYNHNNPLFLSSKWTSFSSRSLQRRFQDLYRMAGIYGASSHSGRRTFATRLIEQGVDIKALATLMGHSSIAMTAKYVEDNPERLKKIASTSLNFL